LCPNKTCIFVLCDFGRSGQAYVETDPTEADASTIVRNLLRGQYDRPVRVLALNVEEGWVRDVSEIIAAKVQDVARSSVGCKASNRSMMLPKLFSSEVLTFTLRHRHLRGPFVAFSWSGFRCACVDTQRTRATPRGGMKCHKFINLFGAVAAAWSLAAHAQDSATMGAPTATSPQIEVARVKPVDRMPPDLRLSDNLIDLMKDFSLSSAQGIGGSWGIPPRASTPFDSRYGQW
jgi:hypothetical protein